MPKFCSECGTAVGEGDKFCPRCGYNLRLPEGPAEPQDKLGKTAAPEAAAPSRFHPRAVKKIGTHTLEAEYSNWTGIAKIRLDGRDIVSRFLLWSFIEVVPVDNRKFAVNFRDITIREISDPEKAKGPIKAGQGATDSAPTGSPRSVGKTVLIVLAAFVLLSVLGGVVGYRFLSGAMGGKVTITGTVTAPAAAAEGGVTGAALAQAVPPYVVTLVTDRARHVPCDPGPCRRVPNAPVGIVRPTESGWWRPEQAAGTTDSNGDFSVTVDKGDLTGGGPVFIAAWDPDGFALMSTIPADLVKAGATLNLPVDRTTTAAAVMHCPGGVFPPRGGYCYSDPGESASIEPLYAEIDRYLANHPSATLDPGTYLAGLLEDPAVLEALNQVLEANGLPATSARQVLDNTTELPTTPAGLSVTGGDKFQFTAPSTLTATAGERFEYSFCDPKPATPTSPCGPMPATKNPAGGSPPYHFVLGSGTGFPPFGLSLGKDGILSGTVDRSESGKTRTIEVCAVDLKADSVCRQVTITVGAAPDCAGSQFAGTQWSGTIWSYRTKSEPPAYTATFEFTFGSPKFSSSGCTVPVVRATVNDPASRWAIDANAVDPPRASELICSATACREFHLIFGMPGGPGVPSLGGRDVTALRLDSPSIAWDSGPSTLTATTIKGSAGAGRYGGGCCGPGDFTANRR